MGRVRAADRASRGHAFRHVAAYVALVAVTPLRGAPDLILHVRRHAFDVALVLGLTEAARTGLEDLLLRDVTVAVPVRLVAVAADRAVCTVALGGVSGALVEVLEEGVYGLVLAHRLGLARLVADRAHRLHRSRRQDGHDDLVDDRSGDDGVAFLDRVAQDR